MRMKLLIICMCLMTFTHAFTGIGDESFSKMCKFWGGSNPDYKERLTGPRAMNGDTCSMHFPIGMGDVETARRYCEENVPFHIRDVEVKQFETICKVEATLKCEDGWTQMFGRCYKIEKKMMTRDHALAHCKAWKEKATIAFMHRESLPFRVRDYFTHVSRVWMDASETVTNVLEYQTGPNLLLAIDGYKYHLPNLAFAQVPIDEKAMALCEYTPDMTQAESNWLLSKYGEIYYPTIFTSDRAYVRSASSYQRDEKRLTGNRICQKILKPFLRSESIGQAADPSIEFLDALSQEREAVIIRTAVYSGDSSEFNRKSSECTRSTAKNYGYDVINNDKKKPLFKNVEPEVWRKGGQEPEPTEMCDAAYWSTGVVMSREGARRLETMSDARYAPIYCQTNFEKMGYGPCPDTFTEFWREERGQKWCHKVVKERKEFHFAERYCYEQEDRSFVTGFTNETELAFLGNLIYKYWIENNVNADTMSQFFLGTHKRGQCLQIFDQNRVRKAFHPDPYHPCSKKRMFEWGHGVALNPPEFDNHWVAPSEPNYANDNEQCVELLRGYQHRWKAYGDLKLNDVGCQHERNFMCGKEAPIISLGLQNQ